MNATVTIGRSSECNIMVSDGNVSRIHARISRVGGQYVFEDVSSNGSVLNGQVIHGRRITVAPAPTSSLPAACRFRGTKSTKCSRWVPSLLTSEKRNTTIWAATPATLLLTTMKTAVRQASGFSLSSSPSLDGFSGAYGTTVFPTVPAVFVRLPGSALALT